MEQLLLGKSSILELLHLVVYGQVDLLFGVGRHVLQRTERAGRTANIVLLILTDHLLFLVGLKTHVTVVLVKQRVEVACFLSSQALLANDLRATVVLRLHLDALNGQLRISHLEHRVLKMRESLEELRVLFQLLLKEGLFVELFGHTSLKLATLVGVGSAKGAPQRFR